MITCFQRTLSVLLLNLKFKKLHECSSFVHFIYEPEDLRYCILFWLYPTELSIQIYDNQNCEVVFEARIPENTYFEGKAKTSFTYLMNTLK